MFSFSLPILNIKLLLFLLLTFRVSFLLFEEWEKVSEEWRNKCGVMDEKE
jgi:hypothetical protein